MRISTGVGDTRRAIALGNEISAVTSWLARSVWRGARGANIQPGVD